MYGQVAFLIFYANILTSYHLLSHITQHFHAFLISYANILTPYNSNRCKDVFKQPPFVAYRRSSNLRDLLVKAQLPVISNNHFPPGSFRCGENCATCPYITNGLTSYTFYATGEHAPSLHTSLVTLKT